jgi:hypothetical protein
MAGLCARCCAVSAVLALVEAMKLAFAAATDGSEVKNVHVIGDSFRAISAKLSPAYVPRLLSVLDTLPF